MVADAGVMADTAGAVRSIVIAAEACAVAGLALPAASATAPGAICGITVPSEQLLTVTTTDGRRLSRRIDHLVGRGPANPMSAAELQEKFCDCANRVLPAARSEQAYRALLGLPTMADVRELVATLLP